MSEKCLDPYINTRRMDPIVVERRARFSFGLEISILIFKI